MFLERHKGKESDFSLFNKEKNYSITSLNFSSLEGEKKKWKRQSREISVQGEHKFKDKASFDLFCFGVWATHSGTPGYFWLWVQRPFLLVLRVH